MGQHSALHEMLTCALETKCVIAFRRTYVEHGVTAAGASWSQVVRVQTVCRGTVRSISLDMITVELLVAGSIVTYLLDSLCDVQLQHTAVAAIAPGPC